MSLCRAMREARTLRRMKNEVTIKIHLALVRVFTNQLRFNEKLNNDIQVQVSEGHNNDH